MQDAGDFSKFQLGRLVKQNKLTQLLENVRQEMNYSAGGLDSIVSAAEGATVESNRVMSDDTAQYVLIKGGATQETAEGATKSDTELEDTAEPEDQQDSNASNSKSYRMNNSFAIRKLTKDRNAGKKFAPVCVINLSSSGSSSSEEEEVIRQPKKKAQPVSRPSLPPAAVSVTRSNISMEQPIAAKSSPPPASVTSSQASAAENGLTGYHGASKPSVALPGRAVNVDAGEVKVQLSSERRSLAAESYQSQQTGSQMKTYIAVKESTINAISELNKLAAKSVTNEQLERSIATESSEGKWCL